MALTEEERRDLRELHLLTAKPVMYVANVMEDGFDEQSASGGGAGARARPKARWSCRCARRSKRRSRSSRKPIAPSFSAELGLDEPGLNRVIRAGLQAARPADLLHRRREGSARLDGARRLHRAAGGRRDPHGFRARLHPRRSDRATTITSPARARRARRKRASCGWKARNTWCSEGDVMHFRFNV